MPARKAKAKASRRPAASAPNIYERYGIEVPRKSTAATVIVFSRPSGYWYAWARDAETGKQIVDATGYSREGALGSLRGQYKMMGVAIKSVTDEDPYATTHATRRKYSAAAADKIGRTLREFGRGELRSGSGGKVTSQKQAIAIGISQARRAGYKVPAETAHATRRTPTRPATTKSTTVDVGPYRFRLDPADTASSYELGHSGGDTVFWPAKRTSGESWAVFVPSHAHPSALLQQWSDDKWSVQRVERQIESPADVRDYFGPRTTPSRVYLVSATLLSGATFLDALRHWQRLSYEDAGGGGRRNVGGGIARAQVARDVDEILRKTRS